MEEKGVTREGTNVRDGGQGEGTGYGRRKDDDIGRRQTVLTNMHSALAAS